MDDASKHKDDTFRNFELQVSFRDLHIHCSPKFTYVQFHWIKLVVFCPLLNYKNAIRTFIHLVSTAQEDSGRKVVTIFFALQNLHIENRTKCPTPFT